MRTLNLLKATTVAKKDLAPGRYADGGCLYLQVHTRGSRAWVFEFTRAKVVRSMGLGPFREVTLALARELAADARALLAKGIDPIEQRKIKAQADRAERAKRITFRACAEEHYGANSVRWRN